MISNMPPNSRRGLEYLTYLILSLNQVISDAEVPEGSPRPRSGSPARSRSGSPMSREVDDMAETQIEADAETQVSVWYILIPD